MKGRDPENVRHALSMIDQGNLFEKFAKQYLPNIIGSQSFLPVGGIKDRGIDSLKYTYFRKSNMKDIYQFSIQQNYKTKINETIKSLDKNGINFSRLVYVTNLDCPDKEKIAESIFDRHEIHLLIYDIGWLASNVNNNGGTIRTYDTFIDSYFHEFQKPGKTYIVGDLISDPRLFVFLRQQLDETRHDRELDKTIADALILYALEGTDPDMDILMSEDQIKNKISELVKYDPRTLYPVISERLKYLSTKPRQIKYHSQKKGYCLPYDTRVEIRERNIHEFAQYEHFQNSLEEKVKIYLGDVDVAPQIGVNLIEQCLNSIFKRQGLEFADFVLRNRTEETFEKDLSESISVVVEKSTINPPLQIHVKKALLMTIRDLVYNGTDIQKLFINRLANTYMILFLLQCEPQLVTYFESLASHLTVFVGTSIIVPALSEIYLSDTNRRYWNLLKGARSAGVKIFINDDILNELVDHIHHIKHKYESIYCHEEDLFSSDEHAIIYVDEILIRAYFYARLRGHTYSFDDFIDNFVNPNLHGAKDQLILFLSEEFGIKYIPDSKLNVKIEKTQLKRLTDSLEQVKKHKKQAQRDAHLILTIFGLREMNNEKSENGIFGFSTWWLSSDVVTYKTITKEFGNSYPVSCYMRPDFLYNYIALAPTRGDVDAAYAEFFPSLLGVNVSYHVSADLIELIHRYIVEFYPKRPSRVKAIISDLSEKLKFEPNHFTRAKLISYFEEKLKCDS